MNLNLAFIKQQGAVTGSSQRKFEYSSLQLLSIRITARHTGHTGHTLKWCPQRTPLRDGWGPKYQGTSKEAIGPQ